MTGIASKMKEASSDRRRMPSSIGWCAILLPLHHFFLSYKADTCNIGDAIAIYIFLTAQAGYRTVIAGKWDAGMATPTHTPFGRGYDSALCYFHHGEWLR